MVASIGRHRLVRTPTLTMLRTTRTCFTSFRTVLLLWMVPNVVQVSPYAQFTHKLTNEEIEDLATEAIVINNKALSTSV